MDLRVDPTLEFDLETSKALMVNGEDEETPGQHHEGALETLLSFLWRAARGWQLLFSRLVAGAGQLGWEVSREMGRSDLAGMLLLFVASAVLLVLTVALSIIGVLPMAIYWILRILLWLVGAVLWLVAWLLLGLFWVVRQWVRLLVRMTRWGFRSFGSAGGLVRGVILLMCLALLLAVARYHLQWPAVHGLIPGGLP